MTGEDFNRFLTEVGEEKWRTRSHDVLRLGFSGFSSRALNNDDGIRWNSLGRISFLNRAQGLTGVLWVPPTQNERLHRGGIFQFMFGSVEDRAIVCPVFTGHQSWLGCESTMPAEATDLVDTMLRMDPAKRPDHATIHRTLQRLILQEDLSEAIVNKKQEINTITERLQRDVDVECFLKELGYVDSCKSIYSDANITRRLSNVFDWAQNEANRLTPIIHYLISKRRSLKAWEQEIWNGAGQCEISEERGFSEPTHFEQGSQSSQDVPTQREQSEKEFRAQNRFTVILSVIRALQELGTSEWNFNNSSTSERHSFNPELRKAMTSRLEMEGVVWEDARCVLATLTSEEVELCRGSMMFYPSDQNDAISSMVLSGCVEIMLRIEQRKRLPPVFPLCASSASPSVLNPKISPKLTLGAADEATVGLKSFIGLEDDKVLGENLKDGLRVIQEEFIKYGSLQDLENFYYIRYGTCLDEQVMPKHVKDDIQMVRKSYCHENMFCFCTRP